jgi:beta-carotene 3-hydroxylase
VHEVFIHQRIKWLRNTTNSYFLAIRRAHKVHHKRITKEDGECFGMLLVPLKYYREVLRSRKAGTDPVG